MGAIRERIKKPLTNPAQARHDRGQDAGNKRDQRRQDHDPFPFFTNPVTTVQEKSRNKIVNDSISVDDENWQMNQKIHQVKGIWKILVVAKSKRSNQNK
ncbi:MAG: hypothetical protein R6V16_04695, partial [Bacteroidales bacterium]